MRRIPSAPLLFVGRDDELRRLVEGLARVRVGIVAGEAGVGKSALSYAVAARHEGAIVYTRVTGGEPLSSVVDDARRKLADGPVAEAMDDEAGVTDLLLRLEAARALWVIDDLHKLPGEEGALLVRSVGLGLEDARLLVTTRELLPLRRDELDRVELRLGYLDEPSARTLWGRLDELYGPAVGFDAAFARSRGNPLRLRGAHAGGLDDEDPVRAAVQRLGADEKTLASALALAGMRVPSSALFAILPGERGREAFRRMSIQMMVDVDGTGGCGLHDVYADAVLVELADRAPVHRALAEALRGAPLDPVLRAREVCRHLAAVRADEEAGRFLLESGADLVRHGAAGELLRLFESIPEPRRSRRVEVARARTLATAIHFERAHTELARLAATGEPDAELLSCLGQVSMLTGRLDAAERALETALRSTHEPHLLARVTITLALVQAHRGDYGGAHARIDALRPFVTERGSELATLECAHAFLDLSEERDLEGQAPMARAEAIFAELPPSKRRDVMTPMLSAAIWARAGDLDRARRGLARLEQIPAEGFGPEVDRRIIRAIHYQELGDRAATLRELESLAEVSAEGGYLLGELWARVLVGRMLLFVGRRIAGRAVLESVRARAAPLGIGSVLSSVERSLARDPVVELRARATRTAAGTRPSELSRARALDALLAASANDAQRSVPEDRPLYGLDRALFHLAAMVSARLGGDARAAATARARAEAELAADRLDPDLLDALLEVASPSLITTAAGHRAVGSAVEDDRAVVVDARRKELRAPGLVVSLAQRPTLQKLLNVLAARPNEPVTKESLARALWAGSYRPTRHDAPLKVNVQRLRALLAGTPVSVETVSGGYQLATPPGFTFVEPLMESRIPPPADPQKSS